MYLTCFDQPGSYRIFIGGAVFTKYTFFRNFLFNFEQFFNSCIKIFGGALHHLPIITGIFGGALHHVHHLITTGLGLRLVRLYSERINSY